MSAARGQKIMGLSHYVDTERYSQNLDVYREELQRNGLVVLPHFLRASTLAELIDFSSSHKGDFFRSTVYGNAYLCEGRPELGDDHVLNRNDSTTLGVMALDQVPDGSALKEIYFDPAFIQLVQALTGKSNVYRYECPLGGINVAQMEQGDSLRWHFDLSDFVVSIPLQDAEAGGVYEYIRNLRSEEDPNYSGVQEVLEGARGDVKVLQAEPGSLVLFEGRYTLHRVTEISGNRDRFVALFGFADRSGVTGSDYLRQIRYGRVN